MNSAEVLLFLFDVCVRALIPEIKTFQLLLEADYSAASLAASAKRIFFIIVFHFSRLFNKHGEAFMIRGV